MLVGKLPKWTNRQNRIEDCRGSGKIVRTQSVISNISINKGSKSVNYSNKYKQDACNKRIL